eukprot:4534414-Pyramimonas_sp.AAC.1
MPVAFEEVPSSLRLHLGSGSSKSRLPLPLDMLTPAQPLGGGSQLGQHRPRLAPRPWLQKRLATGRGPRNGQTVPALNGRGSRSQGHGVVSHYHQHWPTGPRGMGGGWGRRPGNVRTCTNNLDSPRQELTGHLAMTYGGLERSYRHICNRN